MTELQSMKNIGQEMARKLTAVGISSAEMLSKQGAKQAYIQLKEVFPNICLVHLYTLEAAIQDTDFNCLSESKKKELKEFSDSFK